MQSGIDSNGDCSHEIKRRLRLGRTAMRKLEKITKSKDVSLETRAEATHTLVCKSWTGKKADRKQLIHLKHGVGGLLYE